MRMNMREMQMTNDLRVLIEQRLNSIKTEYGIGHIGYRRASDQKPYPHIIWNITTTQPMDMGREDYMLDFHVWGREESAVFNIMDAVRNLFLFRNDPTDEILPTFYEMSGGTVEDTDKTIVHGVLRVQCQVYEKGVTTNGILKY